MGKRRRPWLINGAAIFAFEALHVNHRGTGRPSRKSEGRNPKAESTLPPTGADAGRNCAADDIKVSEFKWFKFLIHSLVQVQFLKRTPKAEIRKRRGFDQFGLRISAFSRASDFGFRISNCAVAHFCNSLQLGARQFESVQLDTRPVAPRASHPPPIALIRPTAASICCP